MASSGATQTKGLPASVSQVKGERITDLESKLQTALQSQLEAAEEKKKTAGERLRPTRISKDLTSTLENLWSQTQKRRGGAQAPPPGASFPSKLQHTWSGQQLQGQGPGQRGEVQGKLQKVADHSLAPAQLKAEALSGPALLGKYPHQASQWSHVSRDESPASTTDNGIVESSSRGSDHSGRGSSSLASGSLPSSAPSYDRSPAAPGAEQGARPHWAPGLEAGRDPSKSVSDLSATFDSLQDIVLDAPAGRFALADDVKPAANFQPYAASRPSSWQPGVQTVGALDSGTGLASAGGPGGRPASSGEIDSLLTEAANEDLAPDDQARGWLDKMLEMEPVPAGREFGDECFFDGLNGLDQAFENFAELLPQGIDTSGSNSGGGSEPVPRADNSDAGAMLDVHDRLGSLAEVDSSEDWPNDLQQHTLPAYIQEVRERKRKRKRAASLEPAPPAAPHGSTVDVADDEKEPGDPLALLLAVAQALVAGDQARLRSLLFELNEVASVVGSAMQRLSAYFLEGLIARMGGGPTRAAPAEQALPPDDHEDPAVGEHVMRAFQTLIHSSPYIVFGQVACNSAMLEAFKGQSRVHIVDYGIGHGIQWPSLIQALAAREGGPPHLHITGIDLPAPPGVARANCCINAGDRLRVVAEQWGVPLRYDALPIHLEDVRVDHINIVAGEVVAVNCALRLHQLVDDSVSPSSALALGNVLRTVRDLRPEIVTVVEPHAEHGSPFFLARFYEALHYYAALFEEIGESLPADSADRRAYEQQVLGRAILNVVACEGQARAAERLEPLGHWQSRIRREGFVPRPLATNVLRTASALLRTYREGYKMESTTASSLVLHWKGRPLLVMSSWRPDAS